jgi:hypothetical protein
MADIVLPAPADDEEYVLRKKAKTQLQLLRDERDKLQAELALMVEPSNNELKELGKISSMYYIKDRQLSFVKNEIQRLSI